ncbi:hypothetical protein AC478_01430 [miscellaneous Crenarchaeota group-1 archaeon SG8-32-3]|uniref:Uncharacterized protein n=1 Tax=miscellaneous Crenarchaeota group-1 archaeon SG8-32-3 TaxID=1685125 RepID=A0A0M0BV61_9ARCH|nr:MAG: hypothetical protein AC478_01430 [miscellaneous Crenarchaeota group-1 archaeon SG8-32-3]
MIYTGKLTVTALPPFSFTLSSKIFAKGDRQIRNYKNGRFWQVINGKEKLILAIVAATGTVDTPELQVELKSNKKITAEDKKKAKAAVNTIFSLDLDLAPFYETVKDEQVMINITRKLWGLKTLAALTVFEALIDAIIEQQILMKVATSIENRIVNNFGDVLDLNGTVYYAYPTAQRLANVSAEKLRHCGLSY